MNPGEGEGGTGAGGFGGPGRQHRAGFRVWGPSQPPEVSFIWGGWVLTPKVSPPPGSLASALPLRARPGARVGSRRCRAEVEPSTTATTLPSCRRGGGHEGSCGGWARAASVYNSDLESEGLLLSACETAEQKLRPDSGTAARPGRAAGRGSCRGGGGGGAIPTPLFTDPLVYR